MCILNREEYTIQFRTLRSTKVHIMKKIYILIIFSLLFSPYVSAGENNSESEWGIVPVESELTVNDKDGNPLTINPSCAFDSLTNPDDGTLIDNSFHFYFKPGKNDKLVVFFNGGGACWDDATCLTSLKEGDRPTYNPSIHQANAPIGAGGIFDDDNEENPFKEWSKVFIPYCTGDTHVGSKTVMYTDTGSVTGYPGAQIPVKHHGFDNFLAVRDWIKDHFSTESNGETNKLEDLLVAGSSAGGYGAMFNFPYLQDTFPKTNAVLLSDGAIGVLTQGFLDDTFTVGGNWNLESTLPAIFADYLGFYSAETMNADIFEKLSETYPKSRFSQYTTALDFVQVQFLKIMTMIDNGFTDPNDWGLTYADELFGVWNIQAEISLDDIADNTDNYQFYIGAGAVHTILTDAFAIESIPHPFYDENSAEGVWFADWVDWLVDTKKFNEENLKYSN